MTETRVLTLTDFLLARIAEDEAEAFGHSRDGYRKVWPVGDAIGTTIGGARLRTECEAKRRIVEHLAEYHEWNEPYLLALLAIPYADHPDYRPEWRP